jgi:DNA-binding CsgD family transcriptional regulator
MPSLYDAVLAPQAWPWVLTQVADAVGVDSVDFLVTAPGGKSGFGPRSGRISPEADRLYREYYGSISPRRKLAQRMPVGAFMICHHHFDDDFVRRDEFYNDFCIPMGLRYLATTSLWRENGQDVGVGFQRRVGGEPFAERDLGRLRPLLPHLRRVMQIQHRLSTLEADLASQGTLLDRLDCGVIVVDSQGRVRRCNKAADDILWLADGLRIRDRRLQTDDHDASEKLARLIGEAAQCAMGGSPHKGGGEVAVPRREGAHPLLLLVAPLPATSASRLFDNEPSVAIFVSTLDARETPEQRYINLFKLTPAEARLAVRLAAGDTLDQVAEAFSLSKYTVRAQLRALMGKTGTNRQAELVRLLSTVAGFRSFE